MSLKRKTSEFDNFYIYKGHYMINDQIQDDEGFYKNWYQWATDNKDGTITIQHDIPNTSSYTDWSSAIGHFKNFIDDMS